MGSCVSTNPDEASKPNRERYAVDLEVERDALDDAAIEERSQADAGIHDDDGASSEGRHTTENTFAISLRVKATNIKSYVLHGINSDTDQFQNEIVRQDGCTIISLAKKKFFWAWIDDHIQAVLREHLLARLPPHVASSASPTWAPSGSQRAPQDSDAFCNVATTGNSTTAELPGVVVAHSNNDTAIVTNGDETRRALDFNDSPAALDDAAKQQSSQARLRQQITSLSITVPDAPPQSHLSLADLPDQSAQPLLSPAAHRDSSGLLSPTFAPLCSPQPPVSLSNTIDLELLVAMINDYAGKSKGPRQAFTNRKGRTVTLGDPLSAIRDAPSTTSTSAAAGGTTTYLCAEYLDLAANLRYFDRQVSGTPSSTTMSWFGMSQLDPSVLSNGNASIFSSDGYVEDLSEAGDAVLSPTSTTELMAMSPYAAHSTPWKERPLNTETVRLHNKMLALQEKQAASGGLAVSGRHARGDDGNSASVGGVFTPPSTNTKDELAARRPKVMMQLLFGQPIMQVYWNKMVGGLA